MACAVFVGGVLLTLLYAFVYVAAPEFPGGIPRDDRLSTALMRIGVAMPFVGLGWMALIYRRTFGPEPDHGGWRYRAGRSN